MNNLKVLEVEVRPTSKFGQKARIYFFPKGETILENFAVGRHTRPYEVLRTMLPEVLDKAGFAVCREIPPGSKASWSRYAGCSCPCSPGFILDRPIFGHDNYSYDVYVTYGTEQQGETTQAEAYVEMAAR